MTTDVFQDDVLACEKSNLTPDVRSSAVAANTVLPARFGNPHELQNLVIFRQPDGREGADRA